MGRGRTVRWLLWVPLIAFATLFAVVATGLWKPADRTVHSALVGTRLPAFALPPMVEGRPAPTAQGPARLVNIFASWCVPCAAEAPQLMRLKAMGVPIDGIAIRDTGPAVRGFLARNGDPYLRIGDDRNSAVQLSLGSSGVPETFVVARDGTILAQHVGDVRAEDVERLAALVGGAR